MYLTLQDGIAAAECILRLLSRFHCFFRDMRYRLKGISFYIDEYNKNVTIFKNGHGITINSFRIKVLNWQKFNAQGIERFFDINGSSKKCAVMPGIQTMMSLDKSERLSGYGFWFQSTADIIMFDGVIEDTGHFKKWKFKTDPTKAELIKSNVINLTYAVSVPGLFPVKDGYLDIDEAQARAPSVSELCIKNQINKITYVVSFEKDVHIKNNVVEATVVIPRVNNENEYQKQELKCSDDLFYYRFFFTKRFPKFQSGFRMEWEISEKGDKLSHINGEVSSVAD